MFLSGQETGFYLLSEIGKVIIPFASVIFAICAFIKNEKKERILERSKLYQNLELASIDFFRWEADHEKIVNIMIDPEIGKPNGVSVEGIQLESYVCQALNLFEICVKHEKTKSLPAGIFETWLKWIYNFSNYNKFKMLWDDLKYHYIEELRNLIDKALNSKNYDDFFMTMKLEYKSLDENKYVKECKVESICLINDSIGLYETNDPAEIKKLSELIVGNDPKDYYAIGDIVSGRISEDSKWNKSYLDKIEKCNFDLEPGEKYLKIIDKKQNVIGMILINENKENSYLEIWDINIKSEYQSNGFGGMAIEMLTEYATRKGIKKILLESSINNKKAHVFFESYGFNAIAYEFEKKI